MKKCLIISLLLGVSALLTTACGDLKFGYVPMENQQENATFTYIGTSGGIDYDAKCFSEHGSDYLSFIPSYAPDQYTCLRTCKKRGTTDSTCLTVDNVHYGVIDMTIVYKCEEFDGKLVYVESEYQHCNNACTSDLTECN